MEYKIEFGGRSYDARHGGPFDRGSADSYYGRPKDPHFFVGKTGDGEPVIPTETSDAYWEYMAGYDYNEIYGDKKDYGRG